MIDGRIQMPSNLINKLWVKAVSLFGALFLIENPIYRIQDERVLETDLWH